MTTIGIQFGDSKAVAAVLESGHPKALRNRDGLEYTAAIVTLHKTKGDILVGFAARNHAPQNPSNTVMSIRRLMGRAFDDEAVDRYRRKYPFLKLEPAEGDAEGVRVWLGGRAFSPIELAATIFRKVKSDAEELHGTAYTHAVITVPAYFTASQRDATRCAGEAAGFIVKQVVAEPTAAAIAFGMDLDAHDDRVVLVYDIGGGTFDVSLLSAAGGAFDVMAVEGDRWIGGDDFDELIMNEVLRRVQRAHGVNGRDTPRFMTMLRDATEAAKIALSQQSSATVSVYGALRDADDEGLDIEEDISRDQFESWIAPFIARSVDLTQKVLRDSNFSPADIDTVLLVGRSTLVPMVRRELESVFGREKVNQKIDPMKSVAFGAAHLAARIANWRCTRAACGFDRNVDTDLKCQKCGSTPSVVELRVTCPKCGRVNEAGAAECEECDRKQVADFRDALAMPYGIEIEGGGYKELFQKGTHLPMREPVRLVFRTRHAGQRLLRVPVYQGESEVASENELLGIVVFEIPENAPEGTRVTAEFAVDGDGILQVSYACGGALRAARIRRDALAVDVGDGVATDTAYGDLLGRPAMDGDFALRLASTMVKCALRLGLPRSGVVLELEECAAATRAAVRDGDAVLIRRAAKRLLDLDVRVFGVPVAELALMEICMLRLPEAAGDRDLRAGLRQSMKALKIAMSRSASIHALTGRLGEMVVTLDRFAATLPEPTRSDLRGWLSWARTGSR